MLGAYDFAYLDPPYNQHRYEANYHVWETIVAWDAPEHYGVACKRSELADRERTSVFNRRRAMPDALRACIDGVDARVMVVSYNDESWVGLDELVDMCRGRGAVEILAYDSKRYVGAQIGIHNRARRARRRGVAPAQHRVPRRERRSRRGGAGPRRGRRGGCADRPPVERDRRRSARRRRRPSGRVGTARQHRPASSVRSIGTAASDQRPHVQRHPASEAAPYVTTARSVTNRDRSHEGHIIQSGRDAACTAPIGAERRRDRTRAQRSTATRRDRRCPMPIERLERSASRGRPAPRPRAGARRGGASGTGSRRGAPRRTRRSRPSPRREQRHDQPHGVEQRREGVVAQEHDADGVEQLGRVRIEARQRPAARHEVEPEGRAALGEPRRESAGGTRACRSSTARSGTASDQSGRPTRRRADAPAPMATRP